jgi:TPP-dependent 2-oxoacid decarboxylase
MSVGDFLLRRLREAGVDKIFGVPGDFNLELVQRVEDGDWVTWIGTCNELNASYAADGYARLSGLAALVVTHGVGALSAINGVAGSYSEHVPVVCVCGSLPRKSIEDGRMMHHTLADESHNGFLRAFSEVTVAQAQLTPQNAATEIDRVILAALQHKLPVYVELPSDIAYLQIEVPTQPLTYVAPRSDPERLRACATAIAERLTRAASPAILIDLDANRFGVEHEIVRLAEKRQIPIAAINTSKAVIDETSPYFRGIYSGAASSPAARDAVERSDCLLAIGVRRIDSTSGFFTDALPANTIHLRSYSADVGEDNYQGVTLREVLAVATDALPAVDGAAPRTAVRRMARSSQSRSGALTQAAYWGRIQSFLREADVLIAEDGTSSAGAMGLTLPPRCTFITQAVWGSIGYSLGALLGTLIAAPQRRHLLFIGDGSFQLTAQELSTILRHDLKPVIFLINNAGYTIERTILGEKAHYNDVANWAYAKLPKVFRPDTAAESFVVRTVEELDDVLRTPHDNLVFIESIMGPADAPANLITGGHASADLDYGPRGPQHRKGRSVALRAGRGLRAGN